jgi:hypothetical protein
MWSVFRVTSNIITNSWGEPWKSQYFENPIWRQAVKLITFRKWSRCVNLYTTNWLIRVLVLYWGESHPVSFSPNLAMVLLARRLKHFGRKLLAFLNIIRGSRVYISALKPVIPIGISDQTPGKWREQNLRLAHINLDLFFSNLPIIRSYIL